MGAISNYQTATGVEQLNRITVSELNALNPQEYMNKTVYCSASIRRFSHNGWWYRSCSTANCYKQLQKDEEEDNDYFCPLHGVQKAQPYYRVKMIIQDRESQATLTLMGRQAEQLFNSKCEELLQRRFYPTEQVLPKEIIDQVGQTYLFEVKLNHYGDLMVRNIIPETTGAPQHSKIREQEKGASSSSNSQQQKRRRVLGAPRWICPQNFFSACISRRR